MKQRPALPSAPAPARPRRAVAAASLLALALSACSILGDDAGAPGSSPSASSTAEAPGPDQIAGRARSESDAPVFGARVEVDGAAAVTDGEGRFVLPRPGQDSLLTISTDSAYGYVPVDAQSDERVEVTLHPAPAGSTALRFGGEVRTGRSLLPRTADADAYADAFSGVAPLLAQAEATAVTLAGPLVPDPWESEQDASSAELASALASVGVDAVALSTDRIADAGRQGIASTTRILDDAGVAWFGAGEDLREAWRPRTIDAGTRTVAYIGCQMGAADAPWAAGDARPGAAPCSARQLTRAIQLGGRDADSVAVFIREERPYATAVSPAFSRLVKTAVRAGATVIVGSGTHVAGEVWDFGQATAVHDLGDLLTDDATWASRDGYLLRTDVDGGTAVSVSAEPLTRSDRIPSMVRGDLAEEISRIAAADINDGPLVLAGDIAVVSTGTWTIDQTTAPIEPDDEGLPLELGDGWWLPPSGQQGVSAGYDLVPTGTFEDVDADPSTDGAIGWLLSPGSQLVSAQAEGAQDGQVCEGRRAVRIAPRGSRPATIFTAGTIPLPDVRAISGYVLVTDDSGDGSGRLRGRLRLQWSDGDGGLGEDAVDFPAAGARCQLIRVDTIPPAGADAVRVVVETTRGAAVVDDVHVVAWTKGRRGGRRYSRIRAFDPTQVTLVVDVPRGATPPPGPFRSGSE